jgi:hypothetical protein
MDCGFAATDVSLGVAPRNEVAAGAPATLQCRAYSIATLAYDDRSAARRFGTCRSVEIRAVANRRKPARLPPAFAALEPWVDGWVLADSSARLEKRLTTPLAGIRAFYDAMLPHAETALAYLAQRRLGELAAADEALLKLLLSLAEMGPAVEWYGTGTYPDAFDARRFPLTVTLPDTASQGDFQ